MDGDLRARRRWGLYVHLPFCAHRCSYCTFVSSTALEWTGEVVQATIAEIGRYRRRRRLATLYLGGGTPSLIPLPLLAELFHAIADAFIVSPTAEVTLEANPEDVNAAALAAWRALGVNRLSIGVQAIRDEVLRLLERRHDAGQARRAVALASSAGFSVSADLIVGIPGRPAGEVEAEVRALVALGVQHVSLYLLEMDKPHRLGALAREKPEQFPDDEEQVRDYLGAARVLRRAGFRHYEISNFARPGYRSRHNLRTWRQQPLLAAGVAAHGHCGRVRWANLDDHREYTGALGRGASPRAWRRVLSSDEHEREGVMLALRLDTGVAWSTVERVGRRQSGFARRLDDFLTLSLARRVGERVYLTPRGWLLSSELLRELW